MVSWADRIGTLKDGWTRVAAPVRLFLWGAVAVTSLFILWRTIDWDSAWTTLQTANIGWLIVAALTVAATNLAKAERWRYLLRGASSVPSRWYLLRVLLIGQGLNTFLPVRLGEIARLRYFDTADTPAALGTILLEKALDLLCFIGLAALLLVLIPFPQEVTGQILTFVGTTLLLLCIAAILFIVSQQQRLTHLDVRYPQLRPFLHLYQRFLTGLTTLRQRRDSFALLGWSVVIWALAVSTNLCITIALHLDLPPISAIVLLVLLQIGITVVALPATIGVFEYLCVVILGWFAVPEAAAFGFGLVLHLLVLIPNFVGILLVGEVPRKRRL